MHFTKVFALIFLLAGAMACVEMRVQAPSPVEVSQYSSRPVRVGVTNYCEGSNVSLFVDSDFPVVIEPKHFFLDWGETNYVYMTLSPMNAEGLQEVVLSSESDHGVVDEVIAVKIESRDAPLAMLTPTGASFSEGEDVSVWVNLRNDGNVVLNDVVLVAEFDDEKVFHGSFLSVKPGERKAVRFSLGDFGFGSHDVRIRALAGDFSVERSLTVKVNPAAVPVSTFSNIRYTDDAYVVEYTVFNTGERDIKNLFVTVDDAPVSWNVISPPLFDLESNESEEVEVVLEHSDIMEANVTVALYSNAMLLTEDELEVSPEQTSGITGFFLVGQSLGWAVLIFIGLGVVYFLFIFLKGYKEKCERDTGECPSWWPFG